ncbi:type IV pilus twitching motility protein PilT [bacterium]|nr:type IV pilus twitching motility protein PilT [bacterium]
MGLFPKKKPDETPHSPPPEKRSPDALRPPSAAQGPPPPPNPPSVKLPPRAAAPKQAQQGPIQPGQRLPERAPGGQEGNVEVVRPHRRKEAPKNSDQPLSLVSLLNQAVERGASDLHLSRGVPPTLRLDGYLVPLNYPPLTKAACEQLILTQLTPVQRQKFDETWELDLSLDLPDVGRYRVNVHRQRGGVEAAFRVVNDIIQPIRKLGLPGVVEEIARKHQGLALVTGPTGSGKSTTMAAIVDQINNERQCMVVTIEDPIEYVHSNKRSIIKQREVTSDTRSFSAALRHVLRQDPDVIVIGEMRDLETIQTALIAAETGHLVFATLHTPDASQTIDRMIDVFPPHQQEQTRIQVANTIIAIVAQQLLPVPGNRGRVVATEILIANSAVRKIVRTGKTEQLFSTMQTGWEQGMVTMDKSLKTLYQQGLISFEDAVSRCKYPLEFDQL